MKNIKLSIVVPICNEENNIEILDKEIKETTSKITSDVEIIYINDGSTDNSLEKLNSLKNITIINLNRNYGQSAALDAGFRAATGDYIVSLDGDGQDDPANILKLLEKLQTEDLDVVAGWRRDRKDSRLIRILTYIGKTFRKILVHDVVHDSGCTLRIYKKEAIDVLSIAGEMHRYVLAILSWKGFKIGEIEVNHRPRIYGKSKYTYTKAFRGLLDLIYVWFIQKYSQRPLHVFGYASFFLFFIGFCTATVSIYEKIFFDISLNRSGYLLIGMFLLLTSVILFSFGIVIDLLISIQSQTSPYQKRYKIRNIIQR